MKSLRLSITQSKNLLNIIINIYYRNNSVVSVGMFNKSNIPYKIVLDFSQSKNLLFSSKSAKIEKVL